MGFALSEKLCRKEGRPERPERKEAALGRSSAPLGLLHLAGQVGFHLSAQETVSILTAYPMIWELRFS